MGKVDKSQAIKVVVAGVVLLVAVVMIVSRLGGPSAPKQVSRWFYDVGSGELYTEANQVLPPIARESGSQGVLAHVFACGECTEANRKLAFIEMFTEEGKAYAINPPEDDMSGVNPGRQVAWEPASGEQPQWVGAHTEFGQQIVMSIAQLRRQCQEGFQPCTP